MPGSGGDPPHSSSHLAARAQGYSSLPVSPTVLPQHGNSGLRRAAALPVVKQHRPCLQHLPPPTRNNFPSQNTHYHHHQASRLLRYRIPYPFPTPLACVCCFLPASTDSLLGSSLPVATAAAPAVALSTSIVGLRGAAHGSFRQVPPVTFSSSTPVGTQPNVNVILSSPSPSSQSATVPTPRPSPRSQSVKHLGSPKSVIAVVTAPQPASWRLPCRSSSRSSSSSATWA